MSPHLGTENDFGELNLDISHASVQCVQDALDRYEVPEPVEKLDDWVCAGCGDPRPPLKANVVTVAPRLLSVQGDAREHQGQKQQSVFRDHKHWREL